MGELDLIIQALQSIGKAQGIKTVGTPTTSLPYVDGMFGYNTETDIVSAMVQKDRPRLNLLP